MEESNGVYYVKLPADSVSDADSTNQRLFTALSVLKSLPQIEDALPNLIPQAESYAYLRPNDGPGMRKNDWHLRPDEAFGHPERKTWALEAVNAPFAWGCSTGDTATKIAVIDAGFQNAGNIVSNISDMLNFNTIPGFPHGPEVSSVIAARGNDTAGMTGIMWRAGLLLYGNELKDSTGVKLDPVHGHPYPDYILTAQMITRALSHGARVINISEGVGVAHEGEAHTAAHDTVRSMIGRLWRNSVYAYAGPTPLIVLAAGNAGPATDEYWSDYSGVADYLPNETIVVAGAASTAGQLYDASVTGTPIAIAAPAEAVAVDNGGLFQPIQVEGTSVAAPFVSGAAGLLFSFDPTLTSAEVKQYLIQGAVKGKRVAAATAYGINVSYPLLDVYESLKLVANRQGAPLCGNHVWIANRQVVAQRGSGTEVLAQLDPSWYGAYLNLKHGGHRFEVDYGTAFVFNGTTRGWDYVENSDPNTLDGAMFSSYNESSHDGDVSVGGYTSNNSSTHEEAIVLTVYDSVGSAHVLTTLHFPYTVPGLQCGRKVGQEIVINQDDSSFHGYTITDGIYRCEDSTAVGSWSEVAITGSYPSISPDGENLFIPVDTWANSASAGNTFVRCDSTGVQDTNGLWLETCLTSTITRQLVKMDVYEIPLHGTLPSNIEQNPKWTLPNRAIYWMALSEDNKEFGAGFETLSWSLFLGTGTDAGVDIAIAAMNCTNEYRSSYGDTTLAFGTFLQGTSSYGPNGTNDCWADAGSGISPAILVNHGFRADAAASSARARPGAGVSVPTRRFGITRQASSKVQRSRRVLRPYSLAYKVPGTLWSIDALGHAHMRPSRILAAKKIKARS